MAGHTPWANIAHKKSNRAVYITVYTMTEKGLPKGLQQELDTAVTKIVKKYGDVAIDFKSE